MDFGAWDLQPEVIAYTYQAQSWVGLLVDLLDGWMVSWVHSTCVCMRFNVCASCWLKGALQGARMVLQGTVCFHNSPLAQIETVSLGCRLVHTSRPQSSPSNTHKYERVSQEHQAKGANLTKQR